MSPIQRLTPRAARLLLVMAMGLWGLQFVANHELLDVLSAVDIVVIRFIVVFVVVLAAVATVPSLRPRFTRLDVGIMLLAGGLAVPGAQLMLAQGQNFLAPAMAGLVVATQPAITAALSSLLLRERLGRVAWVGTVLALTGAGTVVVFATGGGTELTVANPWGAALVLGAQVSFAGYTVLTKAVQGRTAPLTLTFSGLLAGSIWLLPLLPAVVGQLGALEGLRWLWFVQLVVGGTLIPYIIWNLALTVLDAAETASYTYLVPLFGVLWSWAILREDLSTVGLAGGVVIVIGVVMTQVGGASRSAMTPDPVPEPTGHEA
ncbi:DMT family transporter [Euzebya tangerina]|uniref:DMT family transporter n=1 Tax=Euzebya tangerina TaxID=591198 RepID=UPI000E316854|nr:EamA family transporter [Euzebya tangerina]